MANNVSVNVHSAKSERTLLIVLVVLGLLFIILFGGFLLIKTIKTKKIAQGFTKFLAGKGINIDESVLQQELFRLTNRELNQIIVFYEYVKDGRPVLASAAAVQIMPSLLKTNLIKVLSTIHP